MAVRLLTPDEAPALVALIRRCYGETYIDPTFYEPAIVQERLENGRLHSIGAFTESGRLVGHMGIQMRRDSEATADAGMTLVDPGFRGRGIARRVARGLVQRGIGIGLIGVHDYPVTVHAATQRIGAGFGVDTGLMLANIPDDVVFEQMERKPGGLRSSSLVRWLPFARTSERRVYLPERYRERIEALYGQAFLPRVAQDSVSTLGSGESELHRVYDERRRVLRIEVDGAAPDLAAAIDEQRSAAMDRGCLVAHVDLHLGDALTPTATEALRGLGFFFAALLPEYRHGDLLRLQWLSDSVEVEVADVLSADSMRAIEAFVLHDRPKR